MILGTLLMSGLGAALTALAQHRSQGVSACADDFIDGGGCTDSYVGDVTVLGVTIGALAGAAIALAIVWWWRSRHQA
jgi:hypothetical protein